MPQCTWKNCEKQATHPQDDNYGHEWANLCNDHHQELESATDSMKPKLIVKAWMLAMDGAKHAAQRMTGNK